MSDHRPVVILGAGGHAVAVHEALRRAEVDIAGFIAPTASWSRLRGVPWLGDDDALAALDRRTVLLVNGIGSAGAVTTRATTFERARALGFGFRTLIDPTAVVFDSARLGEGAVVLAGAIVGADASLGDDVLINTGAIADHHVAVGPHSHISPGTVIAGDVSIGARSHVGIGARIIQGVRVGDASVIGAGAVVLADVPDHATAVGVPARVREEGS